MIQSTTVALESLPGRANSYVADGCNLDWGWAVAEVHLGNNSKPHGHG